MGVTRVSLFDVHQDIRCISVWRIENEVDHNPGGMRQDSDGFLPNRSGDEGEAELFVKRARALQIMNANADMGQASNEGTECHEE